MERGFGLRFRFRYESRFCRRVVLASVELAGMTASGLCLSPWLTICWAAAGSGNTWLGIE